MSIWQKRLKKMRFIKKLALDKAIYKRDLTLSVQSRRAFTTKFNSTSIVKQGEVNQTEKGEKTGTTARGEGSHLQGGQEFPLLRGQNFQDIWTYLAGFNFDICIIQYSQSPLRWQGFRRGLGGGNHFFGRE